MSHIKKDDDRLGRQRRKKGMECLLFPVTNFNPLETTKMMTLESNLESMRKLALLVAGTVPPLEEEERENFTDDDE